MKTREELFNMRTLDLVDAVLLLREANQRLLVDLRKKERTVSYLKYQWLSLPLAVIESDDRLMRIDEVLRQGRDIGVGGAS